MNLDVVENADEIVPAAHVEVHAEEATPAQEGAPPASDSVEETSEAAPVEEAAYSGTQPDSAGKGESK